MNFDDEKILSEKMVDINFIYIIAKEIDNKNVLSNEKLKLYTNHLFHDIGLENKENLEHALNKVISSMKIKTTPQKLSDNCHYIEYKAHLIIDEINMYIKSAANKYTYYINSCLKFIPTIKYSNIYKYYNYQFDFGSTSLKDDWQTYISNNIYKVSNFIDYFINNLNFRDELKERINFVKTYYRLKMDKPTYKYIDDYVLNNNGIVTDYINVLAIDNELSDGINTRPSMVDKKYIHNEDINQYYNLMDKMFNRILSSANKNMYDNKEIDKVIGMMTKLPIPCDSLFEQMNTQVSIPNVGTQIALMIKKDNQYNFRTKLLIIGIIVFVVAMVCISIFVTKYYFKN